MKSTGHSDRARHGGGRSASVRAMPRDLDPRDLHVPADTPIVVHRHGPGSYSVALVVEGGHGGLTEREAREVLAKWRARVGGWVTKRDAAQALGISVQMVDVLRRDGRLDAENVNGLVRVSLKSVQAELRRRSQSPGESSTSPADSVRD